MKNFPFASTVRYVVPAVLCMAVCPPLLTSCGDDDPAETIKEVFTLQDEYSQDETIAKGVWNIDGCVTISGNAVVTVEPGTVINFSSPDSYIIVKDNGALNMVGTKEKPIVLTSLTLSRGSWEGVFIDSKNSKNVFKHVEFLNGGSDKNDGAVINVRGGRISMEDCRVDGSLANGLNLSGCYVDLFRNNTITACSAYPVKFFSSIDNSFPAFEANNEYLLNGNNVIRFGYETRDIAADITFPALSVPYSSEGFSVDSKTVTIEAGAQFLFDEDAQFFVDDKAKLVVKGTAEKPVLMDCGNVETTWRGILIRSSANNTIVGLVINMAGYGDIYYNAAALSVNGKASIDNCKITNSLTNGVFFDNANIVKFDNVEIANAARAVFVQGDLGCLSAFGANNVYMGNKDNFIQVTGGEFSGDLTIHKQTVPYVCSCINVVDNDNLTIEPGSVLKFDADANISVGGTGKLTCKGTEKERIILTSLYNDSYWRGLNVDAERDNAVVLEKVTISRTGSNADYSGDRSGIYLTYQGHLSLTDVEITDFKFYGFEFGDQYSEQMGFSQSNVTFARGGKKNIIFNNDEENVYDAFLSAYPVAKFE